jgi:hypothetical protein
MNMPAAGAVTAPAVRAEAVEYIIRHCRTDIRTGSRTMFMRLLRNLRRPAPPVARRLALDPVADELLQQAQQCVAGGEADEAMALCRQALEREPRNAVARLILVRARLPGEIYRQVLRRIHEHLRPRTYVEIGVDKGNTIALVGPETFAIGIDPVPQIECPLTPRTRIFANTSDDFFAQFDLSAELGGLPVDLAFIDGLHHFEFALRDFINIERYCTPASTILVHDCYPLDESTAGRERIYDFWSGDVWKLVVCLKRYRPDLSIHTIGTAPTGLAVIRNLDPASTVLAARLQPICDELIPLPFSAIGSAQAEALNLFPNDWNEIRALLSGA